VGAELKQRKEEKTHPLKSLEETLKTLRNFGLFLHREAVRLVEMAGGGLENQGSEFQYRKFGKRGSVRLSGGGRGETETNPHIRFLQR